MAIPASVPVTLTPEAAECIAGLGIEQAVSQMIEQACSLLPELESIQVNLYDRYELEDAGGLCIDLYSRQPYDRQSSAERELIRWLVRTFPPEILQWVIMDYHPGKADAG